MRVLTRVKRDITNLYKSKILVIDDTELNIAVLLTYLKNSGFYNFETAANGKEALDKITEFQPDLVIVDLVMPVMDGFEFIKRIRSMPEYQTLPIIVQTGMSQPEQQVQAWKNGANDIVAKPIHHLELVSRVYIQLKTNYLMHELEDYYLTAEDDIQLALDLQLSLLPSRAMLEKVREKTGLVVKNMFRPSRFLSGDLWGIKEIDETHFGVWLCDFSGKGIRAAMNTFRLHTLVHELNDEVLEPEKFLYRLNNSIKKFMPLGNFATFLYGVVDLENNVFTYSSASATSPIIYNHENNVYSAGDSAGIPLGVVKDAQYTRCVMDLPKGHSLVLYSDVLWESNEVSGISFSEDDLPYFFAALPKKIKVYDVLKDNISTHDSFSDDLTFIQIFRKEDSDD